MPYLYAQQSFSALRSPKFSCRAAMSSCNVSIQDKEASGSRAQSLNLAQVLTHNNGQILYQLVFFLYFLVFLSQVFEKKRQQNTGNNSRKFSALRRQLAGLCWTEVSEFMPRQYPKTWDIAPPSKANSPG